VCAVLLVFKGLAARRVGGERADWIDFEDWTRHRRYVVAFLATIGVNVLYIFAVGPARVPHHGAPSTWTVLFVVFGVGRKWVLPIAVIATLVIHYAFYKLLRVPLPWGLLQGMAY
jgi:putative tricarboxylic transport membrane protein